MDLPPTTFMIPSPPGKTRAFTFYPALLDQCQMENCKNEGKEYFYISPTDRRYLCMECIEKYCKDHNIKLTTERFRFHYPEKH